MKQPLKEILKKIGGLKNLKESMLKDFKSEQKGMALWNMDMKNAIWENRAVENSYLKKWKNFVKASSELEEFVKKAETKGWFS